MELSRAINQTLENHNPSTLSMPQNTQLQKTGEKELDRLVFDKGMAYLEAARQENFSKETLIVWFTEMRRRGWDNDSFRKRILSVLTNKPFGATKFDEFINAEEIFTREEINLFVNKKINQRKEEYELLAKKVLNEEELAKKGLIEVQWWWENRLKDQLEKHVERIESKCKKLRAQFYKLSEQGKIDLWSKAVEKGIVKDGDKFAHLVLPMLVPQMIEEFEEQIKKESTLNS
jgi:hypothetical protein